MSLCIGLTYDLRSDYLKMGYAPEDVAEFDSDETIAALEQTIRSLGFRTDRIGHGRALAERLVRGDRWDLVFNFAEGMSGRSREAQVPALLELYGIPYTMSDPLVCAATLDKAVAKRIVASAGLATPRFAVVERPGQIAAVDLRYPLFAKPLAEGTGKGIDQNSRIDAPDELDAVCRLLLERYREPVLVEEYLPGREFTVAILGNGSAARALGTMEVEILPHAGEAIYSFVNKEECERLVRYSRPEDGIRQEVEQLALAAYRVLECRDVARADIRCDAAGRPSFMEINPLPGMHPHHSDLPIIATQEGVSFRDLIGEILRHAMDRLGLSAEGETPHAAVGARAAQRPDAR